MSKTSNAKRGADSMNRMVRQLRFMEIYYAVNPQEPPDNWRPEEKRHVVSVANKTKCVVETLRAMNLSPEDWTPAEHKGIKRALWPNARTERPALPPYAFDSANPQKLMLDIEPHEIHCGCIDG